MFYLKQREIKVSPLLVISLANSLTFSVYKLLKHSVNRFIFISDKISVDYWFWYSRQVFAKFGAERLVGRGDIGEERKSGLVYSALVIVGLSLAWKIFCRLTSKSVSACNLVGVTSYKRARATAVNKPDYPAWLFLYRLQKLKRKFQIDGFEIRHRSCLAVRKKISESLL